MSEAEIDADKVDRYIVTRQFVSHEGTHYIGDKLPARVAKDPVWSGSLHYLSASSFIYKVADDETYARLPAHVFNAIKSKQEIDDIIKVGENPVSFNEWVKADEITRVEEENAAEEKSKQANLEAQEKRAEKQHEIANKPYVEARPVVVVHTIPAVDAMQKAAREAADHNADEVQDADERENQDNHDVGKVPEKTVEVTNDADGADTRVNDVEHGEAPDKEGPDSDEATTVVPTAQDDVSDAREPQRETYKDLGLKDLQEALVKRDLPKSGNKAELVERLQQDDLKKG